MSTIVATDIEELAVVELTHELEGFKSGTIGTVVSARPEHDAYTVEVADAKGRMVGLVSATSTDLRVRHRPSSEVVEQALDAETASRVLETLVGLPEPEREILKLYLEGLSLEQIAETLHTTVATVDTFKLKATQRLRAQLREDAA